MQQALDKRRESAVRGWNLTDQVVLVSAGKPIGKPGGLDQTFPYAPHPDYRWLSGAKREGGVLAFDPAEGWSHFEPPVTEGEKVWGPGPAPTGRPIDELEAWLTAREGRAVVRIGAEATSDETTTEVQEALWHARRVKDEVEVGMVERAVVATAAGHAAARAIIRPGVTEREIQIELETAAYRAGATAMGYDSIVGSGPNSAVFHFVPGDRKAREGEYVLIDAGAEVDGYVADVTRTYSAGTLSSNAQWVYEVVLHSLRVATAACTIGTEWGEVHLAGAYRIAASLNEAGIFKVSPEAAVDSGAMAMFLPHGIGHMVGLGVRDASGPAPGRKGDRTFAGIRVRMDLPLLDHYLVTVEPGLYFIPAILKDPARREKYKDEVNWAAIEPFLGLGGVRIEDNILVTGNGPQNLTESIPK